MDKINEIGLSKRQLRHNEKVRARFVEIEEEIKERKFRGEVITEITVPTWMFFYEMKPIDEVIAEKKKELAVVEKQLKELEEEQKWRKLC
jgi:hypothetical protein